MKRQLKIIKTQTVLTDKQREARMEALVKERGLTLQEAHNLVTHAAWQIAHGHTPEWALKALGLQAPAAKAAPMRPAATTTNVTPFPRATERAGGAGRTAWRGIIDGADTFGGPKEIA